MGENFEIKHTRAERKQTRLIRTGESVHAHGWTMIRPGSGSVKSARNWRGSSDLTSPILTIGAACAISTSLARGPGPLSCKTATQISNPPIRLPFNGNWGWWLWPVGTRNRIESNRCFQPSTPPMQMHPSILFFPLFLFYPPRFIVPSLSDRSKYSLFIEERGREREVSLAAYATCPIRRAKIVKRGEKGAVEVDVGAGNAHAYGRRREILVTVWIISNRPLTFSPICNSTRIFRAQPGIESNGYTDARFHSPLTPFPLLSSSPVYVALSFGDRPPAYSREFWLFERVIHGTVEKLVARNHSSRIRFTFVVARPIFSFFFENENILSLSWQQVRRKNLTFDP